MTLLGDANWWMPAWLDRLLPRIDSEAARAARPDLTDEDAMGRATESRELANSAFVE